MRAALHLFWYLGQQTSATPVDASGGRGRGHFSNAALFSTQLISILCTGAPPYSHPSTQTALCDDTSRAKAAPNKQFHVFTSPLRRN